ncbi:uncharacterized protein LOC130559835 [Triplophysa rosa]|uniref:uncharacterized protein LOC130559835 n=1 Tax=Triplophysa rosa TaxID=992332 RepID=UPI0025462D85|nr:uncharacterized protein LOC130559835 [Triplophysa rosa]
MSVMMMSQCFLMFLWSFCGEPSSDLTSFNISDANTTTSPCLIQIGDVPYITCGEAVYNSTTEQNTIIPWTTNTFNVSTTDSSTTPAVVNPSPSAVTTNTAAPVTRHSSPPTESTSHTDTTASINCTFDPCADLQVTCRCSRVTSSDAPESLLSVAVRALTHSVARVEWCAHCSPALQYEVVFSRGGLTQKTLRLSSAARQVFVSELTAEHVYRVCVRALQGRNSSAPKCTSVEMDTNAELRVHVLIVKCVILTLTVITQTFCLIKLCRKQPAENPHLTRLISIPNPAFYNP